MDKQQEVAAANEAQMINVPSSVLDLLRFMCQTWAQVDAWVYATCESEQLGTYPVVQGTSNQIRLKQIGDQPYDPSALHQAVRWMHNAQSKTCTSVHGPKEGK